MLAPACGFGTLKYTIALSILRLNKFIFLKSNKLLFELRESDGVKFYHQLEVQSSINIDSQPYPYFLYK